MKKWISLVLALPALAMLPACQTATSEPPAGNLPFAGLEGTSWRLVEFQSMDDAQGTTRPDDPGKYTMNLMTDGSVAFRLDCNRGKGSWNATPGSDGTTGSISFSQLGMTRAMCPPPSMGEKLARDTQYMRGYIMRDGKLNISLMADGGIYVWETANGVD